MKPQMPEPWRYALGAKVRYRPYYVPPEWQTLWSPQPWRVTSRTVTEMEQVPCPVYYSLQPWELTGTWLLDRPVPHVWEQQLQYWKGAR